MRILIAEDDVLSAAILKRALVDLGHEVEIASDGHRAWELFIAGEPQVLLTDWVMPGLTGPDLIRKVRAAGRTRYTYIILLTILSGTGNLIEGLDAGADDFITKPLDREQLRSRLHVATRVLGLQTELRQLEQLLAMCSYCKQIRDDGGNWLPVDHYIAEHSPSTISHSICDACVKIHFPES